MQSPSPKCFNHPFIVLGSTALSLFAQEMFLIASAALLTPSVKLIKCKIPNLTNLYIHLCGFQINHGVKQCTICQRTNYHNTTNHSGSNHGLNCFLHVMYTLQTSSYQNIAKLIIWSEIISILPLLKMHFFGGRYSETIRGYQELVILILSETFAKESLSECKRDLVFGFSGMFYAHSQKIILPWIIGACQMILLMFLRSELRPSKWFSSWSAFRQDNKKKVTNKNKYLGMRRIFYHEKIVYICSIKCD